ncbi:MAG: type II toxin-antitoxin system RelE/ParE family toxin [Magnetococcales bacterium]|nr:type II toxin-antitoxin system RelE/ParE family toxin [Magnetococcales bacterium]
MSRILFDPRAKQDLEEIWRYIAQDHLSRADAWIDHIEKRLNLIVTQPGMGRAYPMLGSGIRGLPCGAYLILYQSISEGIAVLRIIHAARRLKQAWRS